MSKKRRPNSRRPGAPQTGQPQRGIRPVAGAGTAAARYPEVEEVSDGEQPPAGASYPQTLRVPGHSWSRSLVGILIGVGLFAIVTPLISQIVVLIGWISVGHGASYRDYGLRANRFEVPSGMLAANLGIAMLIPISMGLVGFVHRVRPRWLASVRPGLRWRYLVLAMVTAVVALGGVQALAMAAGPAFRFSPQPGFWAFLVVIVLTSPLQAAGEEYFFRGYLMQAFGSMVSNQWFGIIVSSVVFALAHFSLDPALFADRLVFGLLAALLVRFTGGLEAGIAAHVINNVLAFTLAGLTSSIATVRTITTLSWTNAGVTSAVSPCSPCWPGCCRER